MRKRSVLGIAGLFVALTVIVSMPKTGICEEQQKQAEESKKIYDTKPLIKLEEEISTEEKQLKLLEIKTQKKKCEREIKEIEAQIQEIESMTGEQAGTVYQRRKIKRGKEGGDVNWLSKAYLKMMFKKQNVNYAMISFNEREITVKEGDSFEGYKVEKITTDCVVLKAGKIIERISW
ncbi:type IV pilus biogenesis protein PilP [Candidatus Woesearchaeota archaeon]|nr:type IV pilus biogenesis protein PilP [Candidatus Woesearchaeota archaeon]